MLMLVTTVCFAYYLRLFCVQFAYQLLFSLTNNALIYICLRTIFAYNLRIFCVSFAYKNRFMLTLFNVWFNYY